MLRVDPEPFDRLTAPREIEGRLFLPRSPERDLKAIEGSRIGCARLTIFTGETKNF